MEEIIFYELKEKDEIIYLEHQKSNNSCIDLFDISFMERKDSLITFLAEGIIFDENNYEYEFYASIIFDLSKDNHKNCFYEISNMIIDDKPYETFIKSLGNISLKEIYNSLRFKVIIREDN